MLEAISVCARLGYLAAKIRMSRSRWSRQLTAATVTPYEAKGTKAGKIFKVRGAADLNKGTALDPANVDDASDGDGNPITVKTYNPKLTDRKNFKFHNA